MSCVRVEVGAVGDDHTLDGELGGVVRVLALDSPVPVGAALRRIPEAAVRLAQPVPRGVRLALGAHTGPPSRSADAMTYQRVFQCRSTSFSVATTRSRGRVPRSPAR